MPECVEYTTRVLEPRVDVESSALKSKIGKVYMYVCMYIYI